MQRIEKLRNEALSAPPNTNEFFYLYIPRFDGHPELSDAERYADAYKYAFENMTPVISDGELIVGKYCPLCEEQRKNLSSVASSFNSRWEKVPGQDSHMSIDYPLLLNLGINGIIKKIDGYLVDCTDDKKEFYNLCKSVLYAVLIHSENYAKHAQKLAEETEDSTRKSELIKIAEICRNVPANPATSFYEAIQSVHFVTHCLSFNPYRPVSQQFQLGHPDRYLLPYYLEDIKKGVITKEYAQLLLDCLGIQINNRVPHGLSSGYLVGGRDESGNIVENDLTYMCMQVVDDIRLVYPAVGLCFADGMTDDSIEKACEILSHGRSHPAIFGDDTITKGLMSYGVPFDRAHNYIHSTCVEITPVAASNVWVASPYLNTPEFLLKIMDREYDSFDSLMATLFDNISVEIVHQAQVYNNCRKTRMENSANPLLSCFVDDCLARGKDIEKGGALYNWIMPSFVGMANLVDSLFAVKTMIFDKKELTMAELSEIISKNFEGHEALRLRLLNSIPKYGNDIDEIDGLYRKIIDFIVDECEKVTDFALENGNFIPSVFCWTMHERMGRETSATPDGRKAGFPLGDGSGPCQGREMRGPTSSIISSTKWEHHKLIGGVAVNMKFSKNSLGPDSVVTMKNLVKTYIERGGFEIQINVVDKETLEKAVETPENYRDLVVRIGGYSDYFVTLSPEMQQEVILRTEHRI